MNSENQSNPGSVFGQDISAAAFKSYLVYLFLLGLIIRAAFLVAHAQTPSYGVLTLDQKYYYSVARMLLAGEDIHRLQGFKPLLYPMFLAVMDKLGGARGIDLAMAAQHLFGVLTGVLVACLGARLCRHRLSGLAGGVLYMLAPVPLCFEGEFLSESSYTFLICLGLLLLLHAAGASGWKAGLLWLAGGAFTVFAAQIRPNILVFMTVYPFYAAWRWWRARHGAALLPLLGLLGGVAMGIPWGFVNRMQSGYFQVIPSAGGINLYLGNARTADGMMPQLPRPVNYNEYREDPVDVWAHEEYAKAMRAGGRAPDPSHGAVSRYWTRRTIDEIRAAPAAWLRLMGRKCWLMLWNAEVPTMKSFAFFQMEYPWLRLLPVRWVVLLMLVPSGIWAAAKSGQRDALFILLFFTATQFAVNLAFFICDRYRYPDWSGLAVFAGGGVLALVESPRGRQWRRAVCMAAVMALMAAISLPNWYGAKLPSLALDYRLRSIAWYEKGHFPEALSDADRSIALEPREVTALHQRGNILLALNRLPEAREDYERTLQLSADDAGVWNNYGVALDGLNLTNEALHAFQRATECHPPSSSAFLGLAFEQIRFGRLAAAAGVLDQFEKQEPGPNAIVLALRSFLAREHGDAARANDLEQQARAVDPKDAAWALERATALGHGTAAHSSAK
jgi:Tfp pilus assembly protein PilF